MWPPVDQRRPTMGVEATTRPAGNRATTGWQGRQANGAGRRSGGGARAGEPRHMWAARTRLSAGKGGRSGGTGTQVRWLFAGGGQGRRDRVFRCDLVVGHGRVPSGRHRNEKRK